MTLINPGDEYLFTSKKTVADLLDSLNSQLDEDIKRLVNGYDSLRYNEVTLVNQVVFTFRATTHVDLDTPFIEYKQGSNVTGTLQVVHHVSSQEEVYSLLVQDVQDLLNKGMFNIKLENTHKEGTVFGGVNNEI